MEHLNRYSTFVQLHPKWTSDRKPGVWNLLNQPVSGTEDVIPVRRAEEVICPEPRRAVRAPCVIDSLSRVCCRPKGMLSVHRGISDLEILDMILSKDDSEEDSDTSNQMGFFCGSPPVRTSNPVVHDAQFVKQTSSVASPLGNSQGGKPPARVERGPPSCGSSFGGKPKVRIEGFASGNSEPRCVVSALA